ncbi:MAG: transglycosylase domain-containing protein, partial [Spirochaetota bacterium]
MKKLQKIERILIIALIVLAVVLGAGTGLLISAFENTTDIAELEHFKPEIPSKIYDRNGTLISELFTVKREPVSFPQLPKHLINALLAIEDLHFYDHRGIHFKRVLGALTANIRAGRIEQGASTITMQLARTLFTGREKTYERKLKEMWLSLKIEKKYSKNEILTLYFNQIYLGHGAYGIQAASQFYFNKRVEDLTLAESAMLAGLPQSPNRLSPLRNPNLARRRQELVLEQMVASNMVSREEAYDSFQDFWVDFRMQLRSPSQSVRKLTENRAPHFTEYVRQKLEQHYGADRIYTDGLKIYTSLDLTQQEYAEKHLKEGLDRQNEIYKRTTQVVRRTLDNRYIDALDMLSLCLGMNTLDIGAYKVRERVQGHLAESFTGPLDMLSILFGSNNVTRVIESAYLMGKESGEFESVEGALIALEPNTGYITAMVGGSRFGEDNQINRAVQMRRPTGSGFKPYIYAAAVDTKIFTPASVLIDAPVVFIDGEDRWIPKNYSGLYRGRIRLREALSKSVNVVTAKVVDRLGVDTVVKYAADIIGITDPQEVKRRFPRVYSLALGVAELSPLE